MFMCHQLQTGGNLKGKQKIDYIHNNPLENGFVIHPIDWKYSSARNFQDDHTILKIDNIGFFSLSYGTSGY